MNKGRRTFRVLSICRFNKNRRQSFPLPAFFQMPHFLIALGIEKFTIFFRSFYFFFIMGREREKENMTEAVLMLMFAISSVILASHYYVCQGTHRLEGEKEREAENYRSIAPKLSFLFSLLDSHSLNSRLFFFLSLCVAVAAAAPPILIR